MIIRLISEIYESNDENLASEPLSLSEQDYNSQSAIMSLTENTFPKMCFIRGERGGGLNIFSVQIEREIMVEYNRG